VKRNIQLTALAIVIAWLGAGTARAQCDPDVAWTLYRPTREVAEVLVSGNHAWIGGEGGVIRVALDEVSGGDPEQLRVTDGEGLASNDVTCLAEDPFGNLWVGTKENGITVLDPDGHYLTTISSWVALWSELVTAIERQGDRMVVSSIDSFSPQGTREGGGFVFVDVATDGSGGYTYTGAFGPNLEVAQTILSTPTQVWFGTAGTGLWLWDETVDPGSRFRQILTQANGLASSNVKKVLEAPHFDLSGRQVLWLGTGAGLQTYDPATQALDTVSGFTGRNILDLYYGNGMMYVLAEQGSVRDLFTIDLQAPYAAIRVPRSICSGDSTYIPRAVAADASGRIVLGTVAQGYIVREGLDWYCPPPLGPHAPQVADLHVTPQGTVYFGTGRKFGAIRSGYGVGVFDGTSWSSITRADGIVETNMTEVHVWDDGTVWFGTSISQTSGGLDHYFPDTGAIQHYHNNAPDPTRRTQGRHVRSIKEDSEGNLWVCYSQQDPAGGLSMIERPPGTRVQNYDFGTIFSGEISFLRDFDFDSRGRIWICTHETSDEPGKLYVIDTRGTLYNLSDDIHRSFNMANEIVNLGETTDLEIDSGDQIWISGEKGLAVGQIDEAGGLFARWQRVVPTASQAGGRNPLPYRVAELDWEENLWLGTESAGLVRISKDLARWTWFDQLAGCPLPDQSINGLFAEDAAKTMWVGTSSGGIARIDLSGEGQGRDAALKAEPYPNPWNPDADGALSFRNLPSDAAVDLRIYTIAGELVHEQLDAFGAKTWNGTNLGGFLVESGIYVVTATDRSNGDAYEDKVAVVR
jgi:ligand-binding sensor domain-containing protein